MKKAGPLGSARPAHPHLPEGLDNPDGLRLMAVGLPRSGLEPQPGEFATDIFPGHALVP